jgi:hypothetical protein
LDSVTAASSGGPGAGNIVIPPNGIACASNGDVYLVRTSGQIMRINSSGAYQESFASGVFGLVAGGNLEIDPSNDLLFASGANTTVGKTSPISRAWDISVPGSPSVSWTKTANDFFPGAFPAPGTQTYATAGTYGMGFSPLLGVLCQPFGDLGYAFVDAITGALINTGSLLGISGGSSGGRCNGVCTDPIGVAGESFGFANQGIAGIGSDPFETTFKITSGSTWADSHRLNPFNVPTAQGARARTYTPPF